MPSLSLHRLTMASKTLPTITTTSMLPARAAFRTRRAVPPGTRIVRPATAGLHTTPTPRYASKDVESREELEPRPTETAQGKGDDAAAQEGVAFDPDVTRPQEEEGRTSSDNPLSASPSNPEINKTLGKQQGGANASKTEASGESAGRERTSGSSGTPKGGKVGN